MSGILSRRRFLQGTALGAGAALGTRLAGPSWLREASAANEKSALLVFMCGGGFNQMFSATDCCLGRFGVTEAEVETIGNGLAIHKPTFGTLPAFTKQHMATIGVDVPANNDHARATQMQLYDPNGVPWMTRLAAAMGGDGAIKAAHVMVDDNGVGIGRAAAVGGVSMQGIYGFPSLLERIPQLGAVPPLDPKKPKREIHSAANRRIQEMSKVPLEQNPKSLLMLREGYNTAQGLIDRVPKAVDFEDIKQAYGITGKEDTYRTMTRTGNFAAAELLIRTGTNVVFLAESGDFDYSKNFLYTYDSHAVGGTKGIHERHLMNLALPGLRTFASRMLEDPDFNVVIAFIADFGRTNGATDSSDESNNGHSPILSASVMGKYVKTGTTGRCYEAGYVDERFIGGQSPGGIPQLWSYLAQVLKAPTNPFGSNSHNLVL